MTRGRFARVGALGVVVVAALAVSTGCAPASGPLSTGGAVRLPPQGAGFDYQLGGAYQPSDGVDIVVRDRTAPPAGAGYDVCYVNGFQTQPEDSAAVARDRPELLVAGVDGPLVDAGWPDEYLFDTSSEASRSQLVDLVGEQIRGCAADGYATVEIDNLDSYTRSDGALTWGDNRSLAEAYVRIAHDAGLAVAQKNTAEHAEELAAAGFDFAVAESCAAFAECDDYSAVYPAVLDVEYVDETSRDDFLAACGDADPRVSMIRRDLQLVAPPASGHVFEACAS